MWDLIVSVPDHCLSFYFDTPPHELLKSKLLAMDLVANKNQK